MYYNASIALEQALMDANVLKKGHFLLKSGKHSDRYINKDAIYSNTELFGQIIVDIISKIDNIESGLENNDPNVVMNGEVDFDVITGPAIAGAVLAAPIAVLMDKIFVYPEKIVDQLFREHMVFRRGYDEVLRGKKILIVEDIVTTGESLFKTVQAVRDCGGFVTDAICIWNRTNVSGSSMSFTLHSLINQEVKSYSKEECPFCGKIPLTDPKTDKIIGEK